MGHSSEQLHVPHTPRSKERSREKWGGSSWLGFRWNRGIQGWKSSPCSAQHGAENPGLRSDTRQEQTLQASVGLMKGFLKSKISQGIKTNRAEHVGEAAGAHLGAQRLKEAILGTEDLTGMLEASVPSASLEISVPLQSLQGNAIHAWGGSKHGCLKENMLWSQFDDLDGFIPSSNLNPRDSSHRRDCKGNAGASGLILKARRWVAGRTTDN